MRVFITGGTSGIGLSLAELYLAEGHHVGVCSRDITKVPVALKKKFPRLELYEADVTNRDSLVRVVQKFSRDGLDVMVASAGRSLGAKPTWPDFRAAHDIININVLGVFNAFEAALEVMRTQKAGQLVAISSVAGFVGLPGAGAYSASKSAVTTFCESLGIDLAELGIVVSAICPGFIDTPLTRKNQHSMPFIMSSTEGATRIKKAIEKKKRLYIFPLRMKIVMTLLEKMPRLFYRLIWKIPGLSYK